MSTNPVMQDKELMDDCLNSQKQITGDYNTFANECLNAQLRQTVMQLLNDEHAIQSDVFNQIHSRGWYPVPAAQQKKIDETKTRFQNMAAQG